MSSDTPTPTQVHATIDALWVYPVKSCAGVSLQEAELTPTGLAYDRTWMVVDAQGVFVSQRECPRMALIQPAFRMGELVLRAPGMLSLHLALDAAESPRRVQVWDDTVDAFDMGDVAGQWFSDFLGPDAPQGLQRLRLARFDPEATRPCDPAWTAGRAASTQFADGFGLLVTSGASLSALNTRLLAAGQAAVDQRRFRPNLVLSGLEPHDEDRLGPLHIDTGSGAVPGRAVIESVKPCARCPMPDVDPDNGVSTPTVSAALQAYRADPRLKGAITFGMNAIVTEGDGQWLRVGQSVRADWAF